MENTLMSKYFSVITIQAKLFYQILKTMYKSGS